MVVEQCRSVSHTYVCHRVLYKQAVQDLFCRDVHRAGGLIEEHIFCLAGQDPGESYPLLFA